MVQGGHAQAAPLRRLGLQGLLASPWCLVTRPKSPPPPPQMENSPGGGLEGWVGWWLTVRWCGDKLGDGKDELLDGVG